MEDLKQIQEFFSKPLNEISKEEAWKKFQKEKSVTDKTIKAARKDFEKEWEAGKLNEGEQLDIIDFAKVVKAVHQTGHPVTVLLTPKFNEIEVLTGMNAPDDMLRDLSNAVDSLGYGRNDIIIAADSSNLSRREYSDIRRVNGGHKDYFEESVNENALGFNDSRLSSDQHRDLDYAVRGDGAYTFGNDPYADDQLRYKYAVKMGFLNEAEYTDYSNKELAAYCKNNPTDKKAAKELHKRSQALKGLTRTDEAKKLTYNDFVRMVRDDMMAGSAPDERPSEELVGKRAKAYYNEYLQGASVDDLFEATKEEENEFHTKLDKLVHKTFGHSSDEKKKMAEYIAETIKLGLMVNEELCDKGKRYIKARQAAGEKSSAYLSGRAVRVCKGQIEWPKKGKKK